MADIEYSDDEVKVDADAYKTQELAFGKYKGKTFEDMIKTKRTRGYLKYLLQWDELKPETRAHIDNALLAYDQGKKKLQRPTAKATSPKTTPPPKRRAVPVWQAPPDDNNVCE